MSPVPPRTKVIPAEQWAALDKFWQMRRAEILADVQVWIEHDGHPPPEAVIPESQTSFMSPKQRELSLIYEMRLAGYPTAENLVDLMRNHRAEFARIAFLSRQKKVIHDGYEELLALGGTPQTDDGARRVAAAGQALMSGEDGIQGFLAASVHAT